jgi:Domain of unknown function (DUF1905)
MVLESIEYPHSPATRLVSALMEITINGEVWFRRGPSPFHFITVDESASDLIKEIAPSVTYGWGMIPCEVVINDSSFSTSLWPKDGGYILPLKAAVRKATGIEIGSYVEATLSVG